MKKILNLLSILSLLLITSLTAHSHSPVIAGSSPQGITISPASAQVAIQPGEAELPLQFKVTNNESATRVINVTSQDFNTLDETGGLFFVGSNPTALQKKYGLAQWLNIPVRTVTVPPKQTVTIDASVLNLPTLASGGHYGALLLSLAGSQPSASQANNITIHPIASSLLFVTKLGGDTHKLSLANIYLTRSLFNLPGSVTLRFYNNGNTHLIPRGEVTILGPGNKLVSKGIINEDSGIILPQSFRRYTVELRKLSNTPGIGRYRLNVDFRFDGYSQFRGYQTSFWVASWYSLLAVVVAILLIGLLIFRLFRRTRKNTQK